MKPGRELDALVTEKVMGEKVIGWTRYSTSIVDAWTVVEKLAGCYPFILTQDRYGGTYSGGIWLASFGVFMDEYERGPQGDDGDAVLYWANPGLICAGETPAHAICLAALRVVNRENIA